MTIKQWNQAVRILKEQPDIALSEFAEIFIMTSNEAKHLIREVVQVWKIERQGEYPKHIKQPKRK